MFNYICHNIVDKLRDYFIQNRVIHNYPIRISLYRLYNFTYNLEKYGYHKKTRYNIWDKINHKFRNAKSVKGVLHP